MKTPFTSNPLPFDLLANKPQTKGEVLKYNFKRLKERLSKNTKQTLVKDVINQT